MKCDALLVSLMFLARTKPTLAATLLGERASSTPTQSKFTGRASAYMALTLPSSVNSVRTKPPGRGDAGKGALSRSRISSTLDLSCRSVHVERYGRVVADCKAQGHGINEWLVREGWAMAYTRHSTAYVGAEQEAKDVKHGIWIGFVHPP